MLTTEEIPFHVHRRYPFLFVRTRGKSLSPGAAFVALISVACLRILPKRASPPISTIYLWSIRGTMHNRTSWATGDHQHLLFVRVCNFSRRRSILWKSINIRDWKHEGTQAKFGKIGNSPSMSKITVQWTEFSHPCHLLWSSSSLACLRYHSQVLYTFWRDNGLRTRADATSIYRNLCDYSQR